MVGAGKVIGVGFHKTGLSSLYVALNLLGYRITKGRQSYKDKFQSSDDIDMLNKGEFLMLIDTILPFDAVIDNPWNIIYEKLDQRFPDSKFILTLREAEEWLASAMTYFHYRQLSPIVKWIYGVDSLLGNEQILLDRYKHHNQEVLKYFKGRPKDLLIVNWGKGSGWEELCTFLNKPIINLPFPHFNQFAP